MQFQSLSNLIFLKFIFEKSLNLGAQILNYRIPKLFFGHLETSDSLPFRVIRDILSKHDDTNEKWDWLCKSCYTSKTVPVWWSLESYVTGKLRIYEQLNIRVSNSIIRNCRCSQKSICEVSRRITTDTHRKIDWNFEQFRMHSLRYKIWLRQPGRFRVPFGKDFLSYIWNIRECKWMSNLWRALTSCVALWRFNAIFWRAVRSFHN